MSKKETDTEETAEEISEVATEDNENEDTQSEEKVESTVEEDKEEDYLPKKRVIRRKKSKKDKEHPLASAIRLAVESGKVDFGSRKGLKSGILGKTKLFVLASNTPMDVRDSIVKYSKASEIPIIIFEGNNMELGSICGKRFSVSVLSIYEAGNSTIFDIANKEKKK